MDPVALSNNFNKCGQVINSIFVTKNNHFHLLTFMPSQDVINVCRNQLHL